MSLGRIITPIGILSLGFWLGWGFGEGMALGKVCQALGMQTTLDGKNFRCVGDLPTLPSIEDKP